MKMKMREMSEEVTRGGRERKRKKGRKEGRKERNNFKIKQKKGK